MNIAQMNQQADQKTAAAVEAFKGAASGGFNIMGLVANPGKAVEQFGGPLQLMIEGLQQKNEVITALLKVAAHQETRIKRLETLQDDADNRPLMGLEHGGSDGE